MSLVLRKPGVEQDNPLVETVSLADLRYSAYGGASYARPMASMASAQLPPPRLDRHSPAPRRAAQAGYQ